ncbi:MAG: ABC transporter permease [Bacteroidota bacterium]
MFKNYLKTAIRNLWKNKTVSAINIFGLTIGLTCCLLIALYIQHEVSYDKFETKGDRIARVIMEYSFSGSNSTGKGNFTSVRVASVFPHTFPEVEAAVKMVQYSRVVHYGDKLIDENNFMYADPAFFSVFSFPLLQGDYNTALTAAYDVVLTQSAAKKYFGNENPIGKALQVGDDSNLYRVTGVMKDCPSNSQIQCDFVASFTSLGIAKESEDIYWDANYTTYLLLKNKEGIATLQAKLPGFMKKEMEGKDATINFYLEPFKSIHLYSDYDSFVPNNSITNIYILAAVALLILIIACFTYVNLSTARSLERAKEVGVRKVIGAGKKQLVFQFLGESAMICMAAVVCSLIVAVLLIPSFNSLTNAQLKGTVLFSAPFLSFSFITAIMVSILAGIYPAFVFTGFQPIKVLKGSFNNTGSGQVLRKSLIVFQFAISVFLIISTFIVQQQLYFVQHTKLGYDRDHIVVLPVDEKIMNNLAVIKQQLKQNPDILNVSSCSHTPVQGGGGFSMRSALMPAGEQMNVIANRVDEDYVSTAGLQIIAGRDFTSQDIKDVSDHSFQKNLYHFILNESAAKQFGWTAQEAIGKKMFLTDQRPGIVSGVVKDFHFESLHTPIKPFVLFPETFWQRELLVKISGTHLQQTISYLESTWKTLVPHRPFEFNFLDEDYNKLYSSEMRLGTIMNLFAGIAIVLACLGLFGLSAYTLQQRFKEIGIRKVLGASVTNIVIALSKDFIVLTCYAIVIAIPAAWWASAQWLQNFSYRTAISWNVFAIAALATLLLAIITVSFQAIKAALANPVKSLRTE